MVTIQGLPPLPRCFNGMLGSDSNQWKETERTHTIRMMINSGLSTESNLCNGVENGEERTRTVNSPLHGESRLSPQAKLGSALSRLRQEMVYLRQLDMSLLCQLWTLHEAIQDYKSVVTDRHSETNSECSYSIERDLDSITSVEDFETEDLLPNNRPLTSNSLNSSTSSLLRQISQLQQNVDLEFE